MVDGRVVGRPRDGHRFLKTQLWLVGALWLNWRLGGALRWKGKTAGWESRGVVCEKPAPSRLWPPPVSIKDWWVGPHEQVLNVPIACWWHVPSKPSSSLSTEVWLKITASFVGLWEKLGTDPQIDRPTCWRLCREPFFSGAVGSIQICRQLVKDCYALTTWDIYGLGPYTDWAWDACDVLVEFSPTWCTSIRIVATLGYEYRLFVAVIT
jgi:hypothetical protein